jgi:hypothetical protein
MMKSVGKPDAVNPPVRFDERGRETERGRMAPATAPFLDSTDGVNQAADLISDATSIPSLNFTPLTTFGN